MLILGADSFTYEEGNSKMLAMVRVLCPSGVCAVGMYEMVQSRNLGGPDNARERPEGRNSRKPVSWVVRKSDEPIVARTHGNA